MNNIVSEIDLYKRMVATTPATIDPASVKSLGAGDKLKVFDVDELQGRRLVALYIQNVGAVPLKYAVDQGDCNPNLFHGILAGGTVDDDGLGSVLELEKFQPLKDLYVYSTSAGGRFVVLKAFADLG